MEEKDEKAERDQAKVCFSPLMLLNFSCDVEHCISLHSRSDGHAEVGRGGRGSEDERLSEEMGGGLKRVD